jgi:hypothetical protein
MLTRHFFGIAITIQNITQRTVLQWLLFLCWRHLRQLSHNHYHSSSMSTILDVSSYQKLWIPRESLTLPSPSPPNHDMSPLGHHSGHSLWHPGTSSPLRPSHGPSQPGFSRKPLLLESRGRQSVITLFSCGPGPQHLPRTGLCPSLSEKKKKKKNIIRMTHF